MTKYRRTLIIGIFLIFVIILIEVCDSQGSLFKSYIYDCKNADKRLKIATAALKCDIDPEINRDRIIGTIRKIKKEHPDTEMIVFGETILGWFYKKGETKAYHQRIAETIPGKTTELLSIEAKTNSLYISFGITERKRDKIYNSLIIIDPNGKILKIHRKKKTKNPAFDSGDSGVSFINIKDIKTGFVICYDMQSSQTINEIKKNSPDLIIFSVAEYADEWDKNHSFGYGYLAKSLATWLVWSNRVGKEGSVNWDGFIGISNPVGDICLWESGEQQYIYKEIGIVSHQSAAKKSIKNIFMTASIGYFLLKNLNIGIRYLNNGNPLQWWMYWQFWLILIILISVLIKYIFKKVKRIWENKLSQTPKI